MRMLLVYGVSIIMLMSCGKNVENGMTISVPVDTATVENNELKNAKPTSGEGRRPASTPTVDTAAPAVSETKQLRIAFKIPDSMEIKKSYEVLFRLTKESDTAIVLVMKDERKDYRFDSVKVYIPSVKKVKVELSDPTSTSFEIRNNNNGNDEQFLPDETFVEWSWYVTPLKDGNNSLVFRGSFIDDANNYMKVYNRKFYEKSIVVTTSSEYYTDTVAGFFSENWQWFADNFFAAFGGIGGFAAILWAFMRKKKKTEEEKTTAS